MRALLLQAAAYHETNLEQSVYNIIAPLGVTSEKKVCTTSQKILCNTKACCGAFKGGRFEKKNDKQPCCVV